MNSIRKWFYRPRREDPSKLVQFYYADEELNLIAAELDSFDGHKDPDRCSTLVNQLRLCQDKVLNICNEIMDEAIPDSRANRDYCVKFPDEMLHENLAGQLWFGAECLAAGSNVANREEESKEIRPLAKAVTKALDDVRNLLRDHCLRNCQVYSEKLKDSLEIFDKLFAEFELSYVAIMVPIKTLKECHLQQEIVVLFSETLQRALEIDLVTQDMIDDCDPSLMFAVPRLAIVCGLIIYTDGPLNLDNGCMEMSDLFKPFYSTLCEIRELLWTLSSTELSLLEKSLCSAGEFQAETSVTTTYPTHKYQNYVDLFLQNHQSCQQFIQDFYGCHVSVPHDQNFLAPGSITETWQTRESDSNHECLTSCSSLQNTSNCASASSVDGHCVNTVHYTDTTYPYIPNECLSIGVTQTNSTENGAPATNCVNSSSSLINKYSESDFDNNFCNNRTRCSESEQNHEHLSWSTEDIQLLQGDKETRFKGESSMNCQVVDSTREKNCIDDSQEAKDVIAYDNGEYNQYLCEGNITRVTSTQSPDNFSDTAGNSWEHSPRLDDIYDAVESIDDEAIALALQAAEIASRNEARSNFKTSEELIHKLFVEISGVADQLQTNCASDLRNILKSVFNINSLNVLEVSSSFNCNGTGSEENSSDEDVAEERHNAAEEVAEISAISVLIPNEEQDGGSIDSAEEAVPESLLCETTEQQNIDFTGCSGEPPCWMPDEDADQCMSCYAHFTLLRRRHHCRNCGKIFCSRCSSYSISLPHYGHQKPVRVCHRCFIHQVTPYVVSQRCSTCPPL